MPRYRITIEYDGTPFVGWQIQADGRIRAGLTEGRYPRVLGRNRRRQRRRPHRPGRPCAGTGGPFRAVEGVATGSHPRGAQFLSEDRSPPSCSTAPSRRTISTRASAPRLGTISIASCRGAPRLRSTRTASGGFPARLDGKPCARPRACLKARMISRRSAPRSARPSLPLRTLDHLGVELEGNEIRITASARSFLHNQVRSMVGSLKLVGEGKWTVGDLKAALEARDRTACGTVAPAPGLYLVAVDYGAPAPRYRRRGRRVAA